MHGSAEDVIIVRRNAFSILVILAGCVCFLVLALLDLFSIVTIGWFSVPIFGYPYLAFLMVATLWLSWISLFLRVPAVTIDDHSISLTNTAVPTRSTTVTFSQIQEVSSSPHPDLSPNYLILRLVPIDDDQRASGVWSRNDRGRYYYECSNLTKNSQALKSILKRRIAECAGQASGAG